VTVLQKLQQVAALVVSKGCQPPVVEDEQVGFVDSQIGLHVNF
jgi:hypothetical protein